MRKIKKNLIEQENGNVTRMYRRFKTSTDTIFIYIYLFLPLKKYYLLNTSSILFIYSFYFD